RKESDSIKINSQENSVLTSKKICKQPKALQELVSRYPDLKGKSVWFFLDQTKSVEGLILFYTSKKLYMVRDNKLNKDFDSFSKWIKALKTSRKLYKGNRSALVTIFLENNCSSKNIGQILKGEEYESYWKSSPSLNLTIITKTLQEMTIPGKKELHIIFSCLCIFDFKIMALEKPVSITTLPPTLLTISTMTDILNLVKFMFNTKTCCGLKTKGFDDIIRLCENKIMSNELNKNQCHNVIATLEDQGLLTECYRREDCLLIEKDRKT
ncbi:7313_t:CDS:2, partial [Gigaspora rosea]